MGTDIVRLSVPQLLRPYLCRSGETLHCKYNWCFVVRSLTLRSESDGISLLGGGLSNSSSVISAAIDC